MARVNSGIVRAGDIVPASATIVKKTSPVKGTYYVVQPGPYTPSPPSLWGIISGWYSGSMSLAACINNARTIFKKK